MKYNKTVIGIDQSYKNVGISICADGKLKKVTSIHLEKVENNSEKRKIIKSRLTRLLENVTTKSKEVICIIERIRLHSQGFLNIDYIKSIGALNALIVDVCYDFSVTVYSVDTRCWKSTVIGTSKGKANDFGVPEEKWPTVEWLINKGFESSILEKVEGRKNKGTFISNGQKWEYNNDASDSAAIALFGFIGNYDRLKEEH